jgi:hypothetical protein
MYVIAIHGFNANIPILNLVQRFKRRGIPEAGVWNLGDKIREHAASAGKPSYKVEKLGYKDIIYKKHGWILKKGGEKTVKRIVKKIKKTQDKIVIVGHSLGGWSANRLADELIGKIDRPIDLLIQIDALPLWLEYENQKVVNGSAVLTEKWLGSDSDSFFNKFMDWTQNFLDSIKDDRIIPSYLKKNAHQKKYTSSEVKHHLNLYCKEDSWDLTNHFVHAATHVQVGAIPEDMTNYPNLHNDDFEFTHEQIDNRPEVAQHILDFIKANP